MLQDHREQMIENKEQKFFLLLMRKDTISGTTKLYPRPGFIQDLYLCRLHDIKDHVFYWLRRW